MPKNDFDNLNDRRIPGDVKYQPINGLSDFIPMWVADMDFKTAPCVETAVNAVAAKGIYGYQSVDEAYLDAVRSWYSRRFAFEIQDGLIRVNQPQGTYLAWLDCRRLGLSDKLLYNRFLLDGGVRLHKGSTFGKSGEGFMRLNFACPHSVLQEAVQRIRKTITGERSC